MAIRADFLGWATRRSITIVNEAVVKFIGERAPRMAAALAFYATFSLAPLLIFAVALAAVVFGREAAEGKIVGEIGGIVGLSGAATIQALIENAQRPASGALPTAIGAITLLFGATGVVVELQDALNTIWRVEGAKGSTVVLIVRKRLVSLAMVMGIGFLLLVSLILSTFLTAVTAAAGLWMSIPDSMLHLADFVLSLVGIGVLFAMIYKFVPDADVRWRDVWWGAGIASLLFAIGKLALESYIAHSSFASTYGAAGSLVALLVWVYYSAQILLFGAELAAVAQGHATAAHPPLATPLRHRPRAVRRA